MADQRDLYETPGAPLSGAASLSMKELLTRITEDAGKLVRNEIELAKAELRQNVTQTKTMAEGLGVASVLALLGVNMLFVAVAFALSNVMPGWAAALLVAAVLLGGAGIAFAIGWSKRVRTPLEKTRNNAKEDVKWAKERLA